MEKPSLPPVLIAPSNSGSLDGELLKTLEGHADTIRSINFSPDGKTLASASDDDTVKLWNLDLDDLVERGCHWLHDYLTTNSTLTDAERQLCHIPPRYQAEIN